MSNNIGQKNSRSVLFKVISSTLMLLQLALSFFTITFFIASLEIIMDESGFFFSNLGLFATAEPSLLVQLILAAHIVVVLIFIAMSYFAKHPTALTSAALVLNLVLSAGIGVMLYAFQGGGTLDQIALLCVIPAITSLLSIFFVLVDYFNMIRDNSQVRVKRGAAIHKPRTKTSKPKEAERIEKSTQILHNDVEEDMSSYLEDI